MSMGFVVEMGFVCEMYYFVLFVGYGVEVVYLYFVMEMFVKMVEGLLGDLLLEKVVYNFMKVVGKGLQKVMLKMGILMYMLYMGVQIFEVFGLLSDFVEKYFKGIVLKVGGIGLFEVVEEVICLYCDVFGDNLVLCDMFDVGGEYVYCVCGEDYMWMLDLIVKLQYVMCSNLYQMYKEYVYLINDQIKCYMMFCGLFEFKVELIKVILIDDVELVKEIVKCFVIGVMLFGLISIEVYVMFVIVMNWIGGKLNIGEGGEDEKCYCNELCGILIKLGEMLKLVIGDEIVSDIVLKDGDLLCLKIKQVVLGCFGVIVEYLVLVDQIQIKMVQGVKLGEGGQLLGYKVLEYIGKLCYLVLGVGLILLLLYYDIYLIEDLVQLIYDLKNVNLSVSIFVKFVLEVGVGMVVVGVVKVKVDYVVIVGYDGGMGVLLLLLVKYVGMLWEFGFVEMQQMLVLNCLCGCICV